MSRLGLQSLHQQDTGTDRKGEALPANGSRSLHHRYSFTLCLALPEIRVLSSDTPRAEWCPPFHRLVSIASFRAGQVPETKQTPGDHIISRTPFPS